MGTQAPMAGEGSVSPLTGHRATSRPLYPPDGADHTTQLLSEAHGVSRAAVEVSVEAGVLLEVAGGNILDPSNVRVDRPLGIRHGRQNDLSFRIIRLNLLMRRV